jgi:hypothetical protein
MSHTLQNNVMPRRPRVLLVNASPDEYNLGLAKAQGYWLEHNAEVTISSDVPSLFASDFDYVWVSAIFSWDVPRLIQVAQIALAAGIQVEVGGCGTFGLKRQIHEATGLHAQSSPDPRFERQHGNYPAVFWSRGCPAKNCSLGFPRDGGPAVCSVPEMEGWRFTLYPDATPAPVILDNNLSALPRRHQELIVEKTLTAGFEEVDANSGFEPRSFKPETAELWKRLPLVAWRFAYDELAERDAVLRMMVILDDAGIPRKARHIYCLAGNEPTEACEQRVREIQQWKSMPIVQRRRPLDWMGRPQPLPTLHDWTEQKLIDFQRWGNRLSGGMEFMRYRRGKKDGDTQTIPMNFVGA